MKVVDSFESKIKEIAKSISSYKATIILVALVFLVVLIASIIFSSFWFSEHGCPSADNYLLRFFTHLTTPAGSENCIASIGTLIERIGYIAGGLIALSVALATFQRAKAADKTAEAQNETAIAQNETAIAQNETAKAQKEAVIEQEKGNFQERYKDAVNQLNNNEASIRLAGFYGLYHLAQDNDKYSRTICDIFCGYVRERTNSVITVKVSSKEEEKSHILYKKEYSNKPDNEVQSIIDLLTNKNHEKSYPFQSKWIKLSRAYLVGANFNKSILNKAILEEAQLQGANLYNAQLQGAKLEYVQLQGAKLGNARLQGANLSSAQLQGAILVGVRLQGANLVGVRLQGANLLLARLQGAVLTYAQLQGAILNKINLASATAGYQVSVPEDETIIDQLANRIRKKSTDLRTAIFNGGIQDKDIENLEREIKEAETYLKGDSLKIFQNKMREVIQILGSDHKKKDANTNFPPEGYTKISIEDYENPSKEKKHAEKYIITGTLDKATADKIIKELNEIKEDISIKKLLSP